MSPQSGGSRRRQRKHISLCLTSSQCRGTLHVKPSNTLNETLDGEDFMGRSQQQGAAVSARESRCYSWKGAAARHRTGERRSASPQVQRDMWGEGERGQKHRRRLQKWFGWVWGEPVAKRWARRSGSKHLFLSSEFPGSRLAAIPGTGVTFPAALSREGGRSRVHTPLQMSEAHTQTPAHRVQACPRPRVRSHFKWTGPL